MQSYDVVEVQMGQEQVDWLFGFYVFFQFVDSVAGVKDDIVFFRLNQCTGCVAEVC
jgi:hypothetical protein